VHKLFAAATRGRLETSPVVESNNHHHHRLHNTPAPIESSESAVILARSACHAGYLQKLGANIPEFKRRFFVLKPELNLYYFLSPNDTEPRGKLDLEGSRIEEMEHMPDGRFRFVVTWERPERRRIVLEARSKEIGSEWMEFLQSERVSTLKDKVGQLTSESEVQKNQIQDMERQIANFRMIEKDRDGAIEDAKHWKEQFQRLDEAIRLLTQRVRKPPPSAEKLTVLDTTRTATTSVEEEKKEPSLQEDVTSNDDNDNDPALLDDIMEDEQNVEEIMDVPGTYFSALSNACQQQRESLKLAAIEASTAVEDIHAANQELEAMKKRMDKAEKHLTKLWEENCTIRKTLKQKKRERRVLVREVKALQEATREMQEERTARGSLLLGDEGPMEDTLIGSDEDKLISELEEHVASSIRLHERLLVGSEFDHGAEADLNTSIEGSERLAHQSSFLRETSHGATWKIDSSSVSDNGGRNSPLQPTALQTKLHSLFDDGSASESDSEGADVNEYESIGPSISSVAAEMGDPAERRDGFASDAVESVYSDASSPERLNPMLELDEDQSYDQQPHLCPTSSQSASSRSAVTVSVQATSRLVCPLADVIETPRFSNDPTQQSREDLQVYHVTFYSQKIGLQFQKAPPPPSKPKGLLTDVIAADLAGAPNGSRTTAAELRSIAEISNLATRGRGRDTQKGDFCLVALPLDIVLVCGFEGFDDTGMNQKPNLGARLVAFNGVSVEIGQWTFDGIRKAIKSCGRPLTLSFRNDYLTSEQRAILTRAVMEVEVKRPAPRPVLQYGTRDRPPSTTPSINSALSHESDHFVNDGDHETVHSRGDDDYSTSAGSSTCWNNKPSGNSSHSEHGRLRNMCSSNSASTRRSDLRSFSEAGASSVLSSAFAPLVANLLKGVSERKEKFTPDYLHERRETLENTPQHQDFQSNLL
jgi:hypothetical protein